MQDSPSESLWILARSAEASLEMAARLLTEGEGEHAAACYKDAIKRFSGLITLQPGTFDRSLAVCHLNLAAHLSSPGSPNAGIKECRAAVSILRRIASRSEHNRALLAGALHNLALSLASAGSPAEAAERIGEAIAIRRILASDHPQKFAAELLASLGVASDIEPTIGSTETGLNYASEAARLTDSLAGEASKLTRARAYMTLATRYSELNSPTEAVDASQHAIAILDTLPPSLLNDEARSCRADAHLNLSQDLSAIGSHTEALSAAQDALAAYRHICGGSCQSPGAKRGLGLSLTSMSNRLCEVGKSAESHKLAMEAVEVFRTLYKQHPAEYREFLRGALLNLSSRLEDLGLSQESEECRRDAKLP